MIMEMDKDKLIEEMLKDMGDRNNTIDLNAYGRGLIDMYDRVVKKCSIPDVSQHSELFKSFLEKVVEEIEMNCGDLPCELQDEAKELLKLLNCG